ncbi:hypothetical protein M514_12788 [Trichuris suis]|uniref:G-protein coupled receptors family 1 profile domain-containing protein n=1 Tax=Trichuris suis TaxID=68888 RepID=A0A085NHY0_9BILA|nr:hypothetical protein M514_12788 [Trichuris suis]
MTALDCLMKVPSVWCYSFTEPIISSCSLIISVDYFLSLCVLNPKWKVTERFANLFIKAVVALGFANVALSYFTTYERRHAYVNNMCYHSDIIEKFHFRFNFVSLTVVSMCSLLIYVAAVMNLAFRRSSFSVVRLVQVRRQAALRKHAVVAIVCSFMSQCLPHILSVVLTFHSSTSLHDCLFSLYIAFHSGLPAYIFFKKLNHACRSAKKPRNVVKPYRQ